MQEERPFYREIWVGFLTAIGGMLAVGALGLLTWLTKYTPGALRQGVEWVWGLIPTGKVVWPISLYLFAGGLFGLGFSFFIIVRRTIRHLKHMQSRLKDLKDGKIKDGDLTLQELATFQMLSQKETDKKSE